MAKIVAVAVYPMYVTRKLLDPPGCKALIERLEEEGNWYEYAIDDSHGQVRQAIRDLDMSAYADLYTRVLELAIQVNEENWGFHLEGWQQRLRVARYQPGYVHDWHVDYTTEDASKLAMSAPLNDGYEGGDLQLLEVDRVDLPGPGNAVFFPAFHGHRVTAVTGGVRYVLLGWLTGPRFR
jgi:predicted 2-oxoglutarate/Fe(II)-dependent dioxygenase YbiX